MNPSFILHTRPYQETSLLLDVFTKEQGKCTLIAKGGRRQKSPFQGLLQPFTPLLLYWGENGRTALKTLHKAELVSQRLTLIGTNLFAAFYLNELLMRTLTPNSSDETLFNFYLDALKALAMAQLNMNINRTEGEDRLNPIEPILRKFELQLMQQLGYGIDLLHCAATGEPIIDGLYYYYRPEQGFIATMQQNLTNFRGDELKAIATGYYTTQEQSKAAKRFFRSALRPYIGDKPLKSRELFIAPHSLSVKQKR